jgi:asparagine N-glycosylation enzyme membrane subunit Stt3
LLGVSILDNILFLKIFVIVFIMGFPLTLLVSKKTNKQFIDWFPLIASLLFSIGGIAYGLLIELPVWLSFLAGGITYLVGYVELSIIRSLVKSIESRKEKNLFKKFLR